MSDSPNPTPTELRELALAVPECGGMERFQTALTPALVVALVDRLEQVSDDRDQYSGSPGGHYPNPMTTPLLPQEPNND